MPSAANFDYANGLNSKIQTAGGYGIPPGIFSYAFDPTTGMPFMCDPTKTPPGGTSQTNKVAAVNPPTAVKKPKEDEPLGNEPSGNQPPVIQPSVNEPAANEPAANEPSANEPTANEPAANEPTANEPAANEPAANEPAANEPAANEPAANEPSANEPSVSEPSANEPVANQPSAKTNNDATNLGPLSGENTPGFNGQPEERLSPIQATSENQPAEKDTHPVSGTSTTTPPENDKTTAPTNAEHSDDIMTTSSPTNQQDNTANDGVTQTPDQQKTTSSVTESITSSGSNDITLSEHKTASLSNASPQSDEVGNDASHDASDDASSHVQPSDASSPHKGTTVLLGTPLYANKPIKNSNEKSQSSSQNKETEQRLTPLIDNYKQGGATGDVKERQTNKMKTYIKKILKRNEISIKLPEIPACPDMKQYHWPWNCLGKKHRNN